MTQHWLGLGGPPRAPVAVPAPRTPTLPWVLLHGIPKAWLSLGIKFTFWLPSHGPMLLLHVTAPPPRAVPLLGVVEGMGEGGMGSINAVLCVRVRAVDPAPRVLLMVRLPTYFGTTNISHTTQRPTSSVCDNM